MEKHRHAHLVKHALAAGEVNNLVDLFKIVPPTAVATFLGMNPARFGEKIKEKPREFKVREVIAMADYFEIDADKLFSLIEKQGKQYGKKK